MTNPTDHWRLDVLGHTDHMVAVAMDHLDDANEARWLVHRVMLHAMADVLTCATRRDLDTALGQALRDHPVNSN